MAESGLLGCPGLRPLPWNSGGITRDSPGAVIYFYTNKSNNLLSQWAQQTFNCDQRHCSHEQLCQPEHPSSFKASRHTASQSTGQSYAGAFLSLFLSKCQPLADPISSESRQAIAHTICMAVVSVGPSSPSSRALKQSLPVSQRQLFPL